MGDALRHDYFISPEEYLAGESLSQQRHEYLAGVIYAMAGTTMGHGRIGSNINRSLGNQLEGRRCESFTADLRVRIQRDAASFYYYPDVVVDCSGGANTALFAEVPRIIFEVLSPDTERIDRGEKLHNYQSIAALDAYVLVDQSQLAVTVYRRTAEGWVREFYTEKTDTLALPEIECSLPLSTIYERTGLA